MQKIVPPILFCWPTVSEDVSAMAVWVELGHRWESFRQPQRQIPVAWLSVSAGL